MEDEPSDGSEGDDGSTETDGTSGSETELDSSDDPDKVAYTRRRRTGQGQAASFSPAAPVYISSITCTTGDAVLKAGVVHAVLALGEYKVWSAASSNVQNEESERSNVVAPSEFVVGWRPRRSVRLLLAMTQGAWVVSESWLLESMSGRAWKPCGDFIPSAFPGVVAARDAHAAGEPLLNGMKVGVGGRLSIDLDAFVRLVEGAGGVFGNRDAEVIVLGGVCTSEQRARFGTATCVSQCRLQDSIAR